MRATRLSRYTHNTLISLIICVLCLPVLADSDSDWQLKKDDQGVKVYLRNLQDSPYPEVKTVTTINSSMQAVVAAFGDGSRCAKWQPICASAEVLKTVSEQEQLVYMVLDMPWPLSDRDLVTRSIKTVTADAKSVQVQLTSAPGEHPMQKYVRAQSRGNFSLKAVNPSQVEFTWITHTDLGGDLSPDFVIPRLADSIFDDVQRLVKLAER